MAEYRLKTPLTDEDVEKLKAGDTLYIPANTKHTLLKTKKMVVWLAIYIH